jgi:hypothetical protein
MARKKKLNPKPNTPYELPTGLKLVADKFVLGLDPGSKNMGISLVGVHNGKVKVFANSVMMHPVNNLVNFSRSSDAFLWEIFQWVDMQKPDGIIAERFQTRGHGGSLIEMVSSMLGLIRGALPNTPIKLTIASAWKNKFNRRFECDLKDIYPDVLVQPHQLDATLIGIFGLEAGTSGGDLDYDFNDIIKQVEATSLIGLRKVKEKRNANV